MKIKKLTSKTKNQAVVLIFILAFSVIASVIIIRALGASSTATVEPENGNKTSQILTQNNISASGGQNIQFTKPSTAAANRAKSTLGMYLRWGSNGFNDNDEHLIMMEDILNRPITLVRDVIGVDSWTAWNSTQHGVFVSSSGLKNVKSRITIDLIFSMFTADEYTQGNAASVRTAFQKVTAGAFNSHYDEFINKVKDNGWDPNRIWLEPLHEYDLKQPKAFTIANGNADVAAAAGIYFSKYIKQRLPGIKIMVGRDHGPDTYLLANGSSSGKTVEEALIGEINKREAFKNNFDGYYLDIYDRGASWTTQKADLDNSHQVAVQQGVGFYIGEWGCWILNGKGGPGAGDNPQFVQNMFDWLNKLPAPNTPGYLLGHNYFEGLSDSSLERNPVELSGCRSKFHQLFGNP